MRICQEKAGAVHKGDSTEDTERKLATVGGRYFPRAVIKPTTRATCNDCLPCSSLQSNAICFGKTSDSPIIRNSIMTEIT
jgi:hypothetical protein